MRRLFLIVSCWLLAGLAWGGIVPSPEQDSHDTGAPSPWEWQYEGAGALLYVGAFVVAYWLPERWRPVTIPIALLWPILFWAGVAAFKA